MFEDERNPVSEGGLPTGEVGEALESEKRRNDELLTRLKYMQADMENYKKRVEREMREAGESSVKQLALRLLAVVDELDLAFEHAEESEGDSHLSEGIGMVRKNLDSALRSAGVERIECVGKPFDPAYHEAVEKIGDGSNFVVVEELRPGFMFRGRLLRPSMVKVGTVESQGKEEEE